MRILILLLFISTSAWTQQASKEFLALTKVEDQEKFYNELIAKSPETSSNAKEYNAYRAQLAVDWLVKGNIDKYKFYKNTNPRFTAPQLFELTNLLEEWVDENKNSTIVAQISEALIDEVEKKLHDDVFGRNVILYEVNAMANARLGNTGVAIRQIEKSTAQNSPFRQMAYFRNSSANYLNRYGIILSASGQHQRALDTLTNAVRTGVSTPKTIETLKEVYVKLKGKTGVDEYISALQDEAYQKIYKEVEKAWFAQSKPTPDILLTDINGKKIKLSDYKGKVVVIDFWSTSCKPCVAAFPAFERVAELYKDEPFELFVINEGETPDIVRPFMYKKGYQLDVLFDSDEALFNALSTIGTPQKFIIDANGHINQTSIGYAGSDDKEFYKLRAMVELAKNKSKFN